MKTNRPFHAIRAMTDPHRLYLHGFRQIVDALSEDLGSAKGSDLITDVLFIAGRD